MIKLIASDIDGTLVTDGGYDVPDELHEVIRKLRAKGIQFAAASGRQWASIESIFDPVKEKIFYLSDNGAYIGCHGRNLFLNPIERKTVMEMVEDVRTMEGLEVMLSGPDVVYLETKDREFLDWMINDYKFRVETVEDLTKVQSEFIKISVYRKTDVEIYTRHLREKYGERLKITISGDMWVDCMRPGVNKGEAVKILQESLSIKPEETMAFGDQLNDIEMLNQAYYSFAVGNARKEVKTSGPLSDRYQFKSGRIKDIETAFIGKRGAYEEPAQILGKTPFDRGGSFRHTYRLQDRDSPCFRNQGYQAILSAPVHDYTDYREKQISTALYQPDLGR